MAGAIHYNVDKLATLSVIAGAIHYNVGKLVTLFGMAGAIYLNTDLDFFSNLPLFTLQAK